MDKIKVGVVTTSDRASAGIYEDISGKAIMDTFNEYLLNDIEYFYRCIPDEQSVIEETLLELANEWKCDIVVTTGGTGPVPRDVTTEATEAVCSTLLPGFGEQMRAVSLQYVPTAILSRQTAGVCGESLIVNLPGKPKSIRECLDAVFPAIPYCIDLIGGAYMEANKEVIKIFRPKSK
ncbi:MAG TPA: molybdopterin adenylyltransferase [Nitratifractor sp.]|nr:molybdopterin adenylyltransferase [Nitratifractor sp.]